jgi:ABC-2 type transport system permease protein
MLREILPVYKREMKSYISSPALYVTLALFLGFVGLQFYYLLEIFLKLSQQKMTQPQMPYPINLTEIVISNLFGLINFILLFVAPILTMRLFSEEKRLGTFELLVSCPLRDWSILLGKYLAALSVGLIALILCLIYPLTTQYLSGGQAETPVIISCFVGLFFTLAAYIAFGVFASSVTENQMLSAILTFVGLLMFFLIGRMDLAEGKEVFGVQISELLKAICVYTHGDGFIRGAYNLTDLVFFVLFPAFFLMLTSKILEARRWRV